MRFIRILSLLLLLSCLLSSCLSTQPTTDDSSSSTPQANESTTEAVTTEPVETVWLDALPDVDYMNLSEEELWALVPADAAWITKVQSIVNLLEDEYRNGELEYSSIFYAHRENAIALGDMVIPYLLRYARETHIELETLRKSDELDDVEAFEARKHEYKFVQWANATAVQAMKEIHAESKINALIQALDPAYRSETVGYEYTAALRVFFSEYLSCGS